MPELNRLERARRLHRQLVEPHVGLVDHPDVVGVRPPLHRVDLGFEAPHEGRVQPTDELAQRVLLQQQPNRQEHRDDLVGRHVADEGAAVREVVDEPLALQLPQRLTNRRRADPEVGAQLVLLELLPRRDTPETIASRSAAAMAVRPVITAVPPFIRAHVCRDDSADAPVAAGHRQATGSAHELSSPGGYRPSLSGRA